MQDIIIVDLPPAHGEVLGCWYNGYPIHQGQTADSLNHATVYANTHRIIPDQAVLQQEFADFKKTLQKAGFRLHILPFPAALNQPGSLHHDAIYLRDAGLLFKDQWIKARFSVKERAIEAEAHAAVMAKTFAPKVIELPPGATVEFGEVFYLQTAGGSYYFGGLNRCNPQGHDFVRSILKPDHYCLIRAKGYHLDTVFSPVVSAANELLAFLATPSMIDPESMQALERFGVEVIAVDPIDSFGGQDWLGSYAVNTLTAPGVMVNCATFQTPGVEEKIASLKIKRYVSPLTYHRYSGGAYHCLTSEVYL